MPKGPRAGEEPRSHPKSHLPELSPPAGAMPAGAGPAPPPPQLRQRGEGTDATPARAGDALPVPKDIHEAVPTICSLAALPARAPSRHWSAGTGVTPCSTHRPPGTALTPPKTPWEEEEEGFAPLARSFQLLTALLRAGLTGAPPAALIPSPLGAPGAGQAATSLPCSAPTLCRSLNAFLGQG